MILITILSFKGFPAPGVTCAPHPTTVLGKESDH
jgi:hypothetical protein